MPYKIKHRGSGFKVTTPNHPQGFSKKPQSHAKAVAQLRAIKMNTNESLANLIVDALIEPEQSELPMPYSGDPTTLSQSIRAQQSAPHPVIQRLRDRAQAERERAERAKYQSAMTTKPKAIYFSGAGYSGDGMHAVGGGGGLDTGGSAVG